MTALWELFFVYSVPSAVFISQNCSKIPLIPLSLLSLSYFGCLAFSLIFWSKTKQLPRLVFQNLVSSSRLKMQYRVTYKKCMAYYWMVCADDVRSKVRIDVCRHLILRLRKYPSQYQISSLITSYKVWSQLGLDLPFIEKWCVITCNAWSDR